MTDQLDRLKAALSDRYKIERQLGIGGMATVYLAEDLKHKRKVAVKVLRPELAAVLGAERFVQEITTTASLQHPHILPLFDSGEADGFLYYVMPYIEGETLRDKLNRETQLSIDEAVRITTEVADALDSAHQEGVIHRDIKPENILLHKGRAMVADFGIALAVSAAAGGRMTETGLSLGTPHYMSPEQATAEKDLTKRSDIYSLGSVLYEMLTGEPPHMGNSAQQIIMKIVSDTPRPVTELRKSVPPNVAAALGKSLEKLAADRFESAASFAEALANPGFTVSTTRAVGVGGASPRGWWNPLSIGTSVLALAMAILFVWVLLRPIPKPVTRYSIALPDEEALFGLGGTRLAISPDGSRLVYVEGDAQGRRLEGRRLLVRELDQLHATPLEGTDGADHPFFSPDGSRVGFHDRSAGVWWVASLDGGPPVTIADSGMPQGGGSWGRDGYLYFRGPGPLPGAGWDEADPRVGIVRVPEGGGAPEPVTFVDTTRGEAGHAWPEALPGGRGVVFTVLRGAPVPNGRWDIAVADLATGRHAVLLPGVRAVYAASGHLLYVTADGTLMAVPFDESALALTGNGVPITDGLWVGFLGGTDVTISTTGTLFYVTGGVFQSGDAEVVWVTRDGAVEKLDPAWTDDDFSYPTLSPDGTRLAVGILGNGERQIWIKQLDRGPLQRLTAEGTDNRPLGWTPDGQSVVFVSNRGGGRDFFVRRADASAPAWLLLDEEFDLWAASFSPDGQWLVFQGGDVVAGDLYALRMGVDTDPVPLVATEFDETAPALSPDGRWLAYRSDVSGREEVYVRPFPNTSERRWQVSTAGGREPLWAHDGRELFYRELPSFRLMTLEVMPGATFTPGERRELFPAVGMRRHPDRTQYDITPDDRRFVMLRDRGFADLPEVIVVENFFAELKAKVGN